MSGPSRIAGSLRETASRLSEWFGVTITVGQVRHWKKKVYATDDPPKLLQQLMNQKRPPKFAVELQQKDSKSRREEQPSKPKMPQDGLDQTQVEKELAVLQQKLIDAENYEEARTLRTQIAGIRDVLRELREQGRYILQEDAISAASQFAMACRKSWEVIEDEVPPMLDGLTALQMKSKLRDLAKAKISEIRNCFPE